MLNNIFTLTKQKTQLMDEICKITLEQSRLLTPEKSDDLLVIIEKKQGYINTVNEINAELLPLEKKILNCTERSGGEEAKKLYEEKLEEIRILGEKETLLAAKIRKLEEQNIRGISGELQSLKREIETLNAKKGTVKSYRGVVVQTDGYFIDNKK